MLSNAAKINVAVLIEDGRSTPDVPPQFESGAGLAGFCRLLI